MISQYYLNEADLVNAMKLHGKVSPLGVFAFITLGLILLFVSIRLSSDVIMIAGASFIGIGFVLLFAVPINAKRQYRENRGLRCQISFELTEHGMDFRSDMGLSKLDWSDIKKWKRNNEVILIYITSNTFHTVPIRAISNLQELLDGLAKNVGQKSA